MTLEISNHMILKQKSKMAKKDYKLNICSFCGCEFLQKNKHNYKRCDKHRKVMFLNRVDVRPINQRMQKIKERDKLENGL